MISRDDISKDDISRDDVEAARHRIGAHVRQTPVTVLEACLSDGARPDLVSVDGMAHAPQAAHGAAPAGAVGDLA